MKKGSLTKFNEIIAESLQGNSIISPDEEALKEGRNILGIKMVILASHFSNFEDLLNNYGIARFDLESKSEEPQLSEINYLDTIENINLVSVKLHYMKKLLLDRLDVVKAKERIARSSVLAIIEGWAKEKNVKKLTSMLDKGRYDYNMSLENPKRGDADVPTALENPRFIKSFEIITTMFGYPRYGQIDPTPFLFVFFSIFFGIMFGDVLDGLILLVFSLLLFKGYGSKSENGRKLSQVLAAISVSSIFFGFLSGEFAGGVIKLPVIWFNGFDDPMLFLTVAIILGVSQLTLGLVIGLINDLLSKNLKKAIGSRLSWLFILYGSILVLLHYFYSYTNVLDLYAGLALFLSGLAFVLSTSFMEIIDLTRLISNVVSYSRLVAINMSHVGIAKAFALLASSLTESGLLGTMFAVFLLIIVHVFISFIESFVAFAHSLRLQFVEFFSKFFEPVNTAFKPISRRIKSG